MQSKKENRVGKHPTRFFTKTYALVIRYALVMAAATENDHDRKDHDPSAVIVKDVAQAVIHYVCLRELLCGGAA